MKLYHHNVDIKEWFHSPKFVNHTQCYRFLRFCIVCKSRCKFLRLQIHLYKFFILPDPLIVLVSKLT